MTLAVVESDGLDMSVVPEGPGEAGRGVLASGKQHESLIGGYHLSNHGSERQVRHAGPRGTRICEFDPRRKLSTFRDTTASGIHPCDAAPIPQTPIEIAAVSEARSSWSEFTRQEDWWSVILGLCIVGIAYALFAFGGNLNWIAVTPEPWSSVSDLTAQFSQNSIRYCLEFLGMLSLFTLAAWAMGQNVRAFVAGFVVVYLLSLATLVIGAWDVVQNYDVEPPLIALILGALIGNLTRLPERLNEGFRVEFYIKTGIVLLGATLPITLIIWAGPIAIVQASIVSVVTFVVIYRTALFLELDRKLSALLAVGGAICGVSAVIAIAGAIRARREHISVAITSVVLWSIAMILVLPLLARAWY
jgi:hypothetical protein